jgi:outer membrane protein TolC
MVFRYFCFVWILFTVSIAKAQESMMTDVSYEYLDKLIAAAKANYPKVKAYERSIDIARLNVQKANLDWLNILSFIYLYNPAGTAGQTTAQTSILNGFQAGFSLSIGSILQKPGEIRAAKQQLRIAHLSQEEYNLNIEAIVQQRYFTYIQQKTLLSWKIKDLQNMENTLKDIRYKFEKGEETFENYNKAQTSYSSGVQTRIQAEGAFLLAKSSLEEIIGTKLDSLK